MIKKTIIKYHVAILFAIIILYEIVMLSNNFSHDSLSPDARLDISLAESIKEGDVVWGRIKRMVYPTITALLSFLMPIFDAAHLYGPICVLLTTLLTFLIARRVSNDYAGLLAALIVATNPYFLTESIRFLTDVPLTFAFLLTLYALLLFIEKKDLQRISFLVLAVLLCYFTKKTGGYIAPMVIASLILFEYKALKETTQNMKKILAAIITATIAFYIIKGYHSFFSTLFRSLPKIPALIQQQFHVFSLVLAYQHYYIREIYRFIELGVLLFLAGYALFCLRTRNKLRTLVLFWFVLFFLSHPLRGGNILLIRYALPLLPLAAIMIGDSIIEIFRIKMIKKHIKIILPIFVIFLMLCIKIMTSVTAFHITDMTHTYSGSLKYNEWRKESTKPTENIRVIGNHSWGPYIFDKEYKSKKEQIEYDYYLISMPPSNYFPKEGQFWPEVDSILNRGGTVKEVIWINVSEGTYYHQENIEELFRKLGITEYVRNKLGFG